MSFKTKGFGQTKPRLRTAETALTSCLRGVMQDTMQRAQAVGREKIETSGTGRTWQRPSRSGRSGSYPGRVDTGKMRDDFKGEMRAGTPTRIEGSFGWLNTTEMYYVFQEHGFMHWITQEEIEGMQALFSTDEEIYQQFVSDCDQCMEKFYAAI